MDKKWELRKVSTSEQIFRKITEEMAQPVGIVLFGADCDLRNEVDMACIEQIPHLATLVAVAGSPVLVKGLEAPLKAERSVLVTLTGELSGSHDVRHQAVTMLREQGAKTVIGLYAKAAKVEVSQGKLPVSSYWKVRHNQQVDAIEQSDPTTDGLDYFIVVEEEEG